MKRVNEAAPADAKTAYARLEARCRQLPNRFSPVDSGLWIEELRRAVNDLAYFRPKEVDVLPFAVEGYLDWNNDKRKTECARLRHLAQAILKQLDTLAG